MSGTVLAGKVAIVTGGGSGLGRAGALALARAAARVAVTDVSESAAAATAQAIADAGGEAMALVCDAGDSASVQAMVAAVVARWSRIDVLYNNAGIAPVGEDGSVADMKDEAWERVLRTNLTSVFLCSKYAIPHLAKAGGGAIVNTASSMAHLPLGGMDGYAASKGGVALLTKSMAPNAGRLGIRVNAISPGYVDTPMNSMIWDNDSIKHSFDLGHATGLQDSAEIADIVVFLASDAARSLTGAVINCDRGWTAFKMPEMLARAMGGG
jgi:NAD(P)-dependent dehydrogenase (short-subunit alcohol dehydrogenase family)